MIIDDAVATWKFLTDPTNTEPMPDSTEISYSMVKPDSRRFAPNDVHKRCPIFRGRLRADVDAALKLLERASVVGIPTFEATGGRPREVRSFSDAWQCADNAEALHKSEIKLREHLAEVLNTPEPSNQVPEDPRVELALTAFDHVVDPEFFELDYRHQPIFSVEKLRRELDVDEVQLAGALGLLEKLGALSDAYKETNIRARTMRTIRSEWLKDRQRLVSLLHPKLPQKREPYGPARVLRNVSAYVSGQLMTFRAGEIVRNEAHINALLSAGAPIAKFDDISTRMCEKCSHRFDVSEPKQLDYPVLEATQRFLVTHGSLTSFINAGELISDRLKCLRITATKHFENHYRVLPEDEFLCCPKCHHISRDQLKKSDVANAAV